MTLNLSLPDTPCNVLESDVEVEALLHMHSELECPGVEAMEKDTSEAEVQVFGLMIRIPRSIMDGIDFEFANWLRNHVLLKKTASIYVIHSE